MNVAVMKTKAEQALTELFERLAPSFPGDEKVREARSAAIGLFSGKGLPHRRVEEWKYTDLRAATKEVFPLAEANTKIDAAALEKALGPELSALDTIRAVFVNGFFSPDLSRFDEGRGKAYHVETLGHDLPSPGKSQWLKTRLADQSGPKGEAVVALNTAFARDGAILLVEEGVKLDKPIHLIFVNDSAAPSSVFMRNMIGLRAKASATVIESHVTVGAAVQSNAVAEIAVHDGAELDHIVTANGRSGSTHLSTAIVELWKDVAYRAFQFTADAGLARNQTFVTFGDVGSKIDLSGAFLARGNDHIDTTLVVDHAKPHCTSRELFKGVLDGAAHGVFQGKIIVRPHAQKTDGKQMSQALMLSPDAEFDSKPELEIFADDVVCGHGTTSAQLDESMLFYCRSRGIPVNEARALMIQSFVGEAIAKVEHEGIRDALTASANRWLEAGN